MDCSPIIAKKDQLYIENFEATEKLREKYTCSSCNGTMPDMVPVILGIFRDFRKYMKEFSPEGEVNGIFETSEEDLL